MNPGLPSLLGHTTQEIEALLEGRSDARWRARQLSTWIYKKAAQSFDEMNDVPAELRRSAALE